MIKSKCVGMAMGKNIRGYFVLRGARVIGDLFSEGKSLLRSIRFLAAHDNEKQLSGWWLIAAAAFRAASIKLDLPIRAHPRRVRIHFGTEVTQCDKRFGVA